MASPLERGEELAAAPVPTPAVGLHGVVGPFESSREEWCEYAERLGHYCVVNDIVAEEKKRVILLTVVGPPKELVSPRKLEELRFAELEDVASKHYNPKPSPIVKLFEFNSHTQKEGESIAVYVTENSRVL